MVKSPAYWARQKTKTRVKHGKKDSKTLQSALSSGYRTAEESGWKQGREMGPEETQASPPEQQEALRSGSSSASQRAAGARPGEAGPRLPSRHLLSVTIARPDKFIVARHGAAGGRGSVCSHLLAACVPVPRGCRGSSAAFSPRSGGRAAPRYGGRLTPAEGGCAGGGLLK